MALKKIEESGIIPTKQRRVLAKILFGKGNRHISAENLFDEVKERRPQDFNGNNLQYFKTIY